MQARQEILLSRNLTVSRLWPTFLELLEALGKMGVELLALGLQWSLLLAWVAWWLWGVNWKKAWPVLARGAWAPAVLLLLVSALVWSRLTPSEGSFLGLITVPNFWWQLGAVGLLAALTLFCGWLQGVMDWAPAEISLEPPAPTAHHGHGHH
jgi:hypothetical protein